MSKLVAWLLPVWAKTPLQNSEWLQPHVKTSRLQSFAQLLSLLLMLFGGSLVYAIATGLDQSSQSASLLLWQCLYFPTLLLQVITAVAALFLGANAVGAQRRGNTWDHLRVTEIGASLALRARWLDSLHRLRAPVIAIVIVRLILTLAMLVETTAFGGHYVTMLSANGAAPAGAWLLGILLSALSVTASLLLPLIMTLSFAALGILIAIAINDRLFAALIQIILAFMLAAFVSAASSLVAHLLSGKLLLPDWSVNSLILVYSSHGDWGLLHMHLGSLGALWRLAPLGIFISGGLAVLALAQTIIADGSIRLAEGIAERQN